MQHVIPRDHGSLQQDIGALALPEGGESFLPDTSEALDDLTEAQRAAAESNGPTLVLAGAGTGKTKTLTSAISRRLLEGMAPGRILAITFTNRAAGEMRERIEAKTGAPRMPWAGTFHSICCRILREMPDLAGLRPNFDILDSDDSMRVFKSILKERETKMENAEIKEYLRAIDVYKDWLCPPDEAKQRLQSIVSGMRDMGLPISEVHMELSIFWYKLYQQRLIQSNKADFGDLILWVVRGMENSQSLRKMIADKWDAVYVDEYQDVNYAQYRFVRLAALDHRQIFVVGDDDQAIYGFRNSNVAYIRQFSDDFEEASMHRLEENFRSTATILQAANAIIEQDEERLGKTLFTRGETGFPINLVQAYNPEAESDVICGAIQRCRQNGIAYRDMALLYRSNYLSRFYETALRHYRIPYRVVGDVSFWKRQEVKDVLALMRLAYSYDDRQSDDAFLRMINNPKRGLGPKKIELIGSLAREKNLSLARAAELVKLPPKARAAVDDFLEALRTTASRKLSLREMADELTNRTGYRKMWNASKAEGTETRLQNINGVLDWLEEFHSLEEALEFASLMDSPPQEGEDQDCLQLMTIHKSKGLEFAVGFLVAWEDGVLPSDMAIEEGRLDEERRLAYVAMTRCEQYVFISAAAQRPGRIGYSRPSRFLEDIPKEILRHRRY